MCLCWVSLRYWLTGILCWYDKIYGMWIYRAIAAPRRHLHRASCAPTATQIFRFLKMGTWYLTPFHREICSRDPSAIIYFLTETFISTYNDMVIHELMRVDESVSWRVVGASVIKMGVIAFHSNVVCRRVSMNHMPSIGFV